ncbi:MAG TPA: peptidylprolyl isomerase [Isosphaeraceae bacterium]|nr:peptidylprolyl isomerase [Isosphaeraceae bacterium]
MSRRAQAAALTFLLGMLTAGAGPVGAQAQPTGAEGPAARTPAGRAPAIAGAGDVVATITDEDAKDQVTKGELVNFLSRYPIPANENREVIYRDAVDSLANTKLLTIFLNRQKITVPAAKIDEELARLELQLKADGRDLATALLEDNTSLDTVRKDLENRIRWSEYVKAKATDAELRRYATANRDLFSGTQVRASHILLKVEPDAPGAEKDKIKQKLLDLKNQIETNKISFGAAANKYSEDPANSGGAGGDLDYFTLSSGFIPEFTDVAFKLKKGTISDPVETPYGYHLIHVTDRKEGRLMDFDQNKPYILQIYAGELQKNLLTEERKRAKIEVKPMPKELFPPATTSAPAAPGSTSPAAPGSNKEAIPATTKPGH